MVCDDFPSDERRKSARRSVAGNKSGRFATSDRRWDVLIAIHARKSAAAILRFRKIHPDCPIVLLLAGTDLYRDIHRNERAQRSLDLSDRLVVLQSEGLKELTTKHRSKCCVMHQSTGIPAMAADEDRSGPLTSCFEICVVGHLRAVKDPFRAAMAARRLPASSRIRIIHLGAALSDSMERRATAEMKRNGRYRWLGERSSGTVRKYLLRSRAMVISSKLEGGANVVSDAVIGGVPILASKISGTVGQLGVGYRGYFPVGDTDALARLMSRFEANEAFRDQLKHQVVSRRHLFTRDRELAALRELLQSLDLPVQ